MSGNGKKVLASLLGMHINQDPPQFQSLVPQRISSEIMAGALPTFNPTTIMLGNNECCHFMDKAALSIKRKEKIYRSTRSGGSYRMTNKLSFRLGGGTTRPIEQSWYEFQEGVVFITNERIIFVAPENGFEKKVNNLTAIIPYTDAVALQFGSQTITLMLPQPQLMAMVLKRLNSSF